jgi:hypothetical protein
MATQKRLAEAINGLRKKPEQIKEAELSAYKLVRFFELLIEIECNEQSIRNTNNAN